MNMFEISTPEGQNELREIKSQIDSIISSFEKKHSNTDKQIECLLYIRTYDPSRDDGMPFKGIITQTYVIDHKALKEQNNG